MTTDSKSAKVTFALVADAILSKLVTNLSKWIIEYFKHIIMSFKYLILLISSLNFYCGPSNAQKVDTIITDKIDFDFDKAETIRSSSHQFLDSLVSIVNKGKHSRIDITVYCKEDCLPELSTCLSCSRANLIYKYLIANGLKEENLNVVGSPKTSLPDKNEIPRKLWVRFELYE